VSGITYAIFQFALTTDNPEKLLSISEKMGILIRKHLLEKILPQLPDPSNRKAH
jgi:hypothetical protein